MLESCGESRESLRDDGRTPREGELGVDGEAQGERRRIGRSVERVRSRGSVVSGGRGLLVWAVLELADESVADPVIGLVPEQIAERPAVKRGQRVNRPWGDDVLTTRPPNQRWC